MARRVTEGDVTQRRDPLVGLVVTPAGDEQGHVPEGTELDFVVPAFADVEAIRATLTRPAILPLGVLRATNLASPELAHTIAAYVEPEVARRHASDPAAWPLPHPLRQALVALTPFEGGQSRVYLDDEVVIIASARTKYGVLSKGDPVTLDDIVDLRDVRFRDVDIATEPFLWLRVQPDGGVTLYFCFGPAVPHAMSRLAGTTADEATARWAEWLAGLSRAIGDVIAQDLLQQWFEAALPSDDTLRRAMLDDGWFPAPSLLPNPWGAMCAAYARGSTDDATRLAVEALGPAKLRTMLLAWVSREPFAAHREFLEAGMRYFEAGDFVASVSVVLPRIEGIVNRAREAAGVGATPKFAKLFDGIERLGDPEFGSGWLGSRIHGGFSGFVERYFGAHFHPGDADAGRRRGRHAHAHGATEFAQYDARYALQLFLAVDALFFLTTPATGPGADA
jgi:hypothetical protein